MALAAKTPHNSEAVAIFEQVDGDSEFLSQLVNSSQMQVSRHKNSSLFHITDPSNNFLKIIQILPNGLITTTPIYITWPTAEKIEKQNKQTNKPKPKSVSALHNLELVIFSSP